MLDVTEHADDVTAAFEWDCAQLCLDPLTLGVEEDTAVVRSFGRTKEIAHEDFLTSTPLFRSEH
jgi:hypothetical protein